MRNVLLALLRRRVRAASAAVATASVVASVPPDYSAKERDALKKAQKTLGEVREMMREQAALLLYLEALKKQAELVAEGVKLKEAIQKLETAASAAPTT